MPAILQVCSTSTLVYSPILPFDSSNFPQATEVELIQFENLASVESPYMVWYGMVWYGILGFIPYKINLNVRVTSIIHVCFALSLLLYSGFKQRPRRRYVTLR